MLILGEAEGAEVRGKSLYFELFCCEFKMPLKLSLFKAGGEASDEKR